MSNKFLGVADITLLPRYYGKDIVLGDYDGRAW